MTMVKMSPQEAFTHLESNDERIVELIRRLIEGHKQQGDEIEKIKTRHKVDIAILEAKVGNLEAKLNKGEPPS